MEMMRVKKVEDLSKSLFFNYVNLPEEGCGKALWKTPVENSVEIVEKYRFSTAISGF